MITPVLSMGGSPTGPVTNFVSFAPFISGSATSWSSTTTPGVGAARAQAVMVSGTITNMWANFPTAVVSDSYQIALQKNGTITAVLTCTINSSAPCSDTVGSLSVTAGDLIAWAVCPGTISGSTCTVVGTPTAQTYVQLGATFTSTTPGESFLAGGGTGVPSNTTAQYYSVYGFSGVNSTENLVSSLVPTSGVIDNLKVNNFSAPGGSLNWTWTLFKNGAATALTCTYSASTSTCTSSGNAVTVAAGDTISVQSCPGVYSSGSCAPSGTPTASVARFGLRWVPSVPGESIVGGNTIPSISAPNYYDFEAAATNTATESQTLNIIPVGMTIKKLIHSQSTAPGGVTSRAITLRGGNGTQGNVGTPSDVSCTVTSAATGCTDTTNTFSPVAGTFVNWATTVAGGNNAAVTWAKTAAVVTSP